MKILLNKTIYFSVLQMESRIRPRENAGGSRSDASGDGCD